MMQDYPTDDQLKAIRKCDVNKVGLEGMVELIDEAWNHTYGKLIFTEGKLSLGTGGWSGNEDIIAAMIDNGQFWDLYWKESRRGGGFAFS